MEVLEHEMEHVHIIRSGTDVDVDFAAINVSEKRLHVFTETCCSFGIPFAKLVVVFCSEKNDFC